MTRLLALVESVAACAAVWAVLLAWPHHPAAPVSALAPALGLALCGAVSFYFHDLYDLRVARTLGAFSLRLPQALAIALVMAAAAQSALPDLRADALPTLAGLAASCGAVIGMRAWLYRRLARSAAGRRLVLLGSGPLARRLGAEIASNPHHRLTVVGRADPVLDSPEEIESLLASTRPDAIVVAMAERRGRLPVETLLRARAGGVGVEEGSALYERMAGKLAIEALRPSEIVFSPLFRPSGDRVARALSVAAAAAGLALAAPLIALIAAAIKIDSRGPVFFVQTRVGLRGRRFGMVKFRTMHPVQRETSVWVRDNQERITRVGRLLRRFRLDEIPQFLNVLRGDMNLVGPRPHPEVNHRLFAEKIPHYALRCVVRPGVTGWAQVRYSYANNLEEETEKMRYDLYYIKHRSLAFDALILMETCKVVLLGRSTR
ncbi:MAG TPA: exopolysaccharide biosynthesis polyprenyl glycosylphosphotransferase, partial [Candidatus Polarisedimenticolia bacterium]|nr:exopolysaccharide biosynthesis polyprenyl glycosylphosphotransferase [Candidatus Polarisedimenticolia bacterium]